jgi:hypothetical protein
VDPLGAQADGSAPPPSRRSGHTRSQTWSEPKNAASNDCAKMLLQSIQQLDLENSERRQRTLEEQQTIWEATLPKPLQVYFGNHPLEQA